MKHKLYIIGVIALVLGVVTGIVFLSRGPVEAVDPSKDYSKTAKPTAQTLSDSYRQPQVSDARPSQPVATAAPPAADPSTTSTTQSSGTTPSASQDSTTPVTKATIPTAPKTGDVAKKDPVGALLQVVTSLRLL